MIRISWSNSTGSQTHVCSVFLPRPPRVSASATPGGLVGKLPCSSLRPKWVQDSTSPTRDPHNTEDCKPFLWTLPASKRPSLRPIRDCVHPGFRVTNYKQGVEESYCSSSPPHGDLSWGCSPKAENAHSAEDGGSGGKAPVASGPPASSMNRWLKWKQLAYLCTYSAWPWADGQTSHIIQNGQWKHCLLIPLHLINCLNQNFLFILQPNPTDFNLQLFFKVRNSESTEDRPVALS